MSYQDSAVTSYAYLQQKFSKLIKTVNNFFSLVKANIVKFSHKSNVTTKKVKIVLSALVLTTIFVIARLHAPFSYDNVFIWGGIYFILGILSFLLSLWALRPINKYTVKSVLILPSIFVFLGALTIHLIFLFDLARISYILVFGALVLWFLVTLWVFLLMTNILNINMQVFIPISRLAEGVLKLYVLLVHVLYGFIAYILLTGQYLLYGFNIIWLVTGFILIVLVWLVNYRYFARDFSVDGLFFALSIAVILGLVTIAVFIVVPNIFIVAAIILFVIFQFFEYFLTDMRTVE